VAVENGRATYRAGAGESDDVLVGWPLHFTNLGVTVVAFTPQNATHGRQRR
jgi:hypothetical protein